MTIDQMAREYRESSRAYKERVNTLKMQLAHTHGAKETMRLRTRINILERASENLAATACYLEHYHERGISYDRYI